MCPYLPLIDANPHGRIIAGGTPKGSLLPVQGDKQNRRGPTTPARFLGGLKRSAGRLPLGAEDDDFEGVLAVPDIERLGSSPAWRGSVNGRAGRSERNGLAMANGDPRKS